MAKMRIYELAKELNVENSVLLGFLGLDGKTASSSLEDEEVERARRHFAPKAAKAPVKPEALQTSRFAGQSIFRDQAKSEENPQGSSARPESSAAGNAPRTQKAPERKTAPSNAPAQKTIQMWPSVRSSEDKNIFPYNEKADVFFNSNCIYELSVLKTCKNKIISL